MKFAIPFTTRTPARTDRRPRDDEIDLFGLTHPGLVRKDNQDQFLLCTVHPQAVIHGTSLPEVELPPLRGQRLATIMLVADGVGGSVAGSRASRIATEAVTRCVADALRWHRGPGSSGEDEFLQALRDAAVRVHHHVRAEAAGQPEGLEMATTLSLGIVIWPWLYVLQVGDSRCYVYADGVLRQVTRDQTIAQELVERGALSREDARRSPLSHVLSSAIGAQQLMPEVARIDVGKRGTVVLVCSDGLTKHVADAEIARHLGAMTSAEQVCRALLTLALERGGTDNITMVVGHAPRSAPNATTGEMPSRGRG
jgi:protein phosphatase